jgi:hypothetical protein
MRPGELHEAAFRRYCAENNLTFVGAASAIEARSAETGNTDSARKGESAVPQADAK